jgi:hypothetical protein
VQETGLYSPNLLISRSVTNGFGSFRQLLPHDWSRSAPLYQRALPINEKALGSEHPDVATSLNNLAVLEYLQPQT